MTDAADALAVELRDQVPALDSRLVGGPARLDGLQDDARRELFVVVGRD